MRNLFILMLMAVCVSAQLPPLESPPKIIPLLEDLFTSDRSAGAVNGTPADGRTPTQTRTVVDTESKLSVTGGKLAFAGGKATPVTGDPAIYYSAPTSANKVAGTIYKSTVTPASGTITIGVAQYNNLSSGNGFNIQLAAPSSLIKYWDGLIIPTIGAFSYAANYDLTIGVRSVGSFVWVNNKLMWISGSSTYPTYPCFAVYNRDSVSTVDNIRIPKTLYVPTPIASDSFLGRSTLGTTDGIGHAERNGGSGLTWATTGTWAVGTNAAYSSSTVTNIAAVATSSPDVIVDAAWIRDSSTNCFGVIARADDATNPQNYIGLMHSNTVVYLYKREGGATANLATTSSGMTYSAGATLRLVVDGTEVRGFYNNVACGVSTVGAALTNFNNHGLVSYSIYPKATNCVVWARGTKGEYSRLDSLK